MIQYLDRYGVLNRLLATLKTNPLLDVFGRFLSFETACESRHHMMV